MKIAVVGLGNMGGRIAKRLMQQGHYIGVYDADKKPLRPLKHWVLSRTVA
jgi:3-hydroxyisobutyrate dehydrogenase-like beta-hydroxyacid dehydrogenase